MVDSFIPVDQKLGKKRVFTFVRFKSEAEASKGIDLVTGRSWGGRRICAQIAHYKEQKLKPILPFSNERRRNPWSMHSSYQCEGWVVKKGSQQMVRVAPWVIEEEKKTMYNCLVVFLQHFANGIRNVELWWERVLRELAISIKIMDADTMLIQLGLSKEIDAVSRIKGSLFFTLCCAREMDGSHRILASLAMG